MHRKQCNAVVQHYLAESQDDFKEVIAELPAIACQDLEEALNLEGRVLRYDAPSQRAFCMERLSPTLSIWIWQGVQTYEEAARLLTRLVDSDEPLGEMVASAAYVQATGREADAG